MTTTTHHSLDNSVRRQAGSRADFGHFDPDLLPDLGRLQGEAPALPVQRLNSKFARVIGGVQRELPGHFVLEANFVSAWGYDLPVSRNFNFVPRSFLGADVPTDSAANTLLAAMIPNPFRTLLPATSPGKAIFNVSR